MQNDQEKLLSLSCMLLHLNNFNRYLIKYQLLYQKNCLTYARHFSGQRDAPGKPHTKA